MQLEYVIYAEADDFDVKESPDDPRVFWRPCRVDFFEKGAPGVGVLRIILCSPLGLERHMQACKHQLIFGRGLIIMSHYSYQDICKAIDAWLEQASIGSWEEWNELVANWAVFEDENIDLAYPRTLSWDARFAEGKLLLGCINRTA